MKHLLTTTIAAVLVVGCGESQPPELPTTKAPAYPIWQSAAFGDIEAVKQHLAAGTEVDVKDRADETPLHLAALFGQTEIVELLIAKGADVNAKNDGGETPLDRAILRKPTPRTETADLLRKHGGKTGEELKAEGK